MHPNYIGQGTFRGLSLLRYSKNDDWTPESNIIPTAHLDTALYLPSIWQSQISKGHNYNKNLKMALNPTLENLSQIKHQLDATMCRFYFCRVTLHGLGVKRPSSWVLKTGTAAPGTGVIVAGRSSHHHIRDETRFVPNVVMWWSTCNYNTCTRGLRASFLKLLMMGAWRSKHVEWLCRNKTCTVSIQVGVLFDLYYDARKHKSKISRKLLSMITKYQIMVQVKFRNVVRMCLRYSILLFIFISRF